MNCQNGDDLPIYTWEVIFSHFCNSLLWKINDRFYKSK